MKLVTEMLHEILLYKFTIDIDILDSVILFECLCMAVRRPFLVSSIGVCMSYREHWTDSLKRNKVYR